MTKFDVETVLAAFLAVASLSFAPVAQSQNVNPRPAKTIASMDSRSSFATRVENQLRQRGIDARVQLDGDSREVLSVEWSGVQRSDIFGLVSSSAAVEAQRLGFTRIAITNGQQRWDYDLTRESMVWGPIS